MELQNHNHCKISQSFMNSQRFFISSKTRKTRLRIRNPSLNSRGKSLRVRAIFDGGFISSSVSSFESFSLFFGVLTGLGLFYTSKKKSDRITKRVEWILYTNPTPFNRFVILRCPSISLENDENVNEKLGEDGNHFVKIYSKKMVTIFNGEDGEELKYQRICVSADDGGVIALDWPASLDLRGEHGLDTCVLVVPGTPEGSEELGVKSFVKKALQNGVFPIVMNPRGCAGSPLTTPRLFTAADSEDVHLAVNYIARARPRCTMMAVSWGYGANMLTKYLGESAESTPLVAAVSIGNPFDLKAASGSYFQQPVTERIFLEGLKGILERNKALFNGKKNQFDVQRALLATSIRDFDLAISCFEYGIDAVDDFYKESSSSEAVAKIRIPMLFIQDNQVMPPTFLVPRNKIEDNRFTSLLICSVPPLTYTGSNLANATRQWCDSLVMEWFVAVELALLKGRHPLLEDIDVTIKPTTGMFAKRWLPAAVRRVSGNAGKDNKIALEHGFATKPPRQLDVTEPLDVSVGANVTGKSSQRQLHMDERQLEGVNEQIEQRPSNMVAELEQYLRSAQEATHSTGASNEEGQDEEQKDQVIQTAETIMKTLDVTMPGTLVDEQKKQVLNAVQQGETIVSALQSAVPEDVRGKLSTAVSAAVQAKKINFNLVGLTRHTSIPFISQNSKSKANDREEGKSVENTFDSNGLGGRKGQAMDDDISRVKESEESNPKKKSDLHEPQSGDTAERGVASKSSVAETDLSEHNNDNSSTGNSVESMQQGLDSSKIERNAKGGGFVDMSEDQQQENVQMRQDQQQDSVPMTSESNNNVQDNLKNVTLEGNIDTKSETLKEVKNQKNGDTISDTNEGRQSNSESKSSAPSQKVVSTSDDQQKNKGTQPEATSADLPTKDGLVDGKDTEAKMNNQPSQNTKNTNDKNDGTVIQDGTSSGPPSISVQQAFDALTGFDDSTQMAVTNVFGVIEDMIDKMQKEKQDDLKQHGQETKPIKESVEVSSQEITATQLADDKHEQLRQSFQQHKDIMQRSGDNEEGKSNENNTTQLKRKVNEPRDTQTLLLKTEKPDYILSDVKDPIKYGLYKDNGEAKLFYSRLNSTKYKENVIWKPAVNDIESFLCPFADYSCIKSAGKYNGRDRVVEDLSLAYVPEEDQWKVNNEIKGTKEHEKKNSEYELSDENDFLKSRGEENDVSLPVIEPSYIIMDKQFQSHKPVIEGSKRNGSFEESNQVVQQTKKFWRLLQAVVYDALKLETRRRIGIPHVKEFQLDLENDISNVAIAVIIAIRQEIESAGKIIPDNRIVSKYGESERSKFGVIHADLIVDSIFSALKDTSILGRFIPPGVVAGASLAALGPLFVVLTADGNMMGTENFNESTTYLNLMKGTQSDSLNAYDSSAKMLIDVDNKDAITNPGRSHGENNTHPSVVGAVTAALGATMAFKGHEIVENITSNDGIPSDSLDDSLPGIKNTRLEECKSIDPMNEEKKTTNCMTAFAEKAMSVAAPVVPTKKDGALDTEKLLAVLTDLGQKGGFLRLLGKFALLWGGLRGAMSLTNRLLMFFNVAERPLYQRIFGFSCMLLLVWSPVVVPLLPIILQHWALHTSLGFAGFASRQGLYVAVVILIIIWGKRIRGYKKPLERYGLTFSPISQIKSLGLGVFVGSALLMSIYMAFISLGCATFTMRPEYRFSPSMSFVSALGRYWKIINLTIHSFASGLIVSTIKELVFRSWLHEEISSDFGFHRAVIISALAFSTMHWYSSLHLKPGLFLLSLVLSGARYKCNGDLSLAIGLHTAIFSGNFLVNSACFISYNTNAPSWFTGSSVANPLGGALGLGFLATLALFLYPWNGNTHENLKKRVALVK